MTAPRKIHALVCLVLSAALIPVLAQQATPPAAPQAAPRAAAPARDIDPNSLAAAAIQAAQLIDAGRAGEVWDGASAIAKRSVDRKKFTDSLTAQRTPLGATTARRWTLVSRHSTAGTEQLPAGTYANVEFDTQFSGNRSGHELISFRQDEDGTWRLAGYVLK
ncbi:DUF4019 domain-containing protein [Lysobacter arenosi]|uniref:DUF4019 domain-containing protein n=1 Tax=Lysobacter arenosi TaxID=2795387 RepID=A0ABX7RCF1_9GAMM|nr:DUF4019 domain-containing protein [Lysobacter arenosi]QSX74637.1 DUF4019 domain-containing protein [Lysobacter arenosi]